MASLKYTKKRDMIIFQASPEIRKKLEGLIDFYKRSTGFEPNRSDIIRMLIDQEFERRDLQQNEKTENDLQ